MKELFTFLTRRCWVIYYIIIIIMIIIVSLRECRVIGSVWWATNMYYLREICEYPELRPPEPCEFFQPQQLGMACPKPLVTCQLVTTETCRHIFTPHKRLVKTFSFHFSISKTSNMAKNTAKQKHCHLSKPALVVQSDLSRAHLSH